MTTLANALAGLLDTSVLGAIGVSHGPMAYALFSSELDVEPGLDRVRLDHPCGHVDAQRERLAPMNSRTVFTSQTARASALAAGRSTTRLVAAVLPAYRWSAGQGLVSLVLPTGSTNPTKPTTRRFAVAPTTEV